MEITQAFTNAVAANDIKGIRIMMKDSLLVDPTFREFDEMSRLAAAVPGLYDAHDGRSLEEEPSAWDDSYMDKLMVQVIRNFSHERLNHLKKVVRYLRPVTEQTRPSVQRPHFAAGRTSSGISAQPRPMSYQAQKAEDRRNGRIIKVASGSALGAMAGGGIAAGIGVLFGATVTPVPTLAVIGASAIGAAAGSAFTTSVVKED